MRILGRLMQLAGLVAVPAAIALQLPQAISVWQMLALATAGLCAFWIGRLVEGYAR
jgi:hypothetical protein